MNTTDDGVNFEAVAGEPSSEGSLVASQRARFWLYTVFWLILYGGVVVAWGQRNSWPDPLLFCLWALPAHFGIAAWIYRRNKFGLSTDPGAAHRELLIAYLLLAVGLASGILALMILGLVSIGIGWLRPTQRNVDWWEWLKVPFLFCAVLPAGLDLDGGRHGWFRWWEDSRWNPVYLVPPGIEVSRTRLMGRLAVLALVVCVPSRWFWASLLSVPLALGLSVMIPVMWRDSETLTPRLRESIAWWIGAGTIALAVVVCRRQAARSSSTGRASAMLEHWFEERRYAPWVAAIVVAVQQTMPLTGFQTGPLQALGIAGMAVLVLILSWLRLRTPKGPVHSRSVALVAGGLALLLAGEFTGIDQFRFLASGFVLIGLVSWHCFWPLRVYGVAVAAAVMLLGIPEWGVSSGGHETFGLRLVVSAGLLVVLLFLACRPVPRPGAEGYSATAWIPAERFALILFGLVLLFQTAGAFWPTHQPALLMQAPEPLPEATEDPALTVWPREPGQWIWDQDAGSVFVRILEFSRNPYQIAAPERMLEPHGRVVSRRQVEADRWGDAVALELARPEGRSAAAYWYVHGDEIFGNYHQARRVLWSSWHLANRDLRLIVLEAPSAPGIDELVRFARRQSWFRNVAQGSASAAPAHRPAQ